MKGIERGKGYRGERERKLSASIKHHAKNVGIIGILAYPKNITKMGDNKFETQKSENECYCLMNSGLHN